MAGGMVKNLCYFIISLVIAMSKYDQADGKFRDVKGILENRVRSFTHIPPLPHIPQKYFRKGVVYLVGNDSNDERSGAAHSMGKIPSSDFVMLLFQLYFIIGEDGCLLPNKKDFSYRRTTLQRNANNKKKQFVKIVPCGDITQVVLSTIAAVLSLYFECKRTQHTERTLEDMKGLVISVQVIKCILQ